VTTGVHCRPAPTPCHPGGDRAPGRPRSWSSSPRAPGTSCARAGPTTTPATASSPRRAPSPAHVALLASLGAPRPRPQGPRRHPLHRRRAVRPRRPDLDGGSSTPTLGLCAWTWPRRRAVRLGLAMDDPDEIARRLEAARAATWCSQRGVTVGERDYVRRAGQAGGGAALLAVAMKPASRWPSLPRRAAHHREYGQPNLGHGLLRAIRAPRAVKMGGEGAARRT
jgi:hypothetical protein